MLQPRPSRSVGLLLVAACIAAVHGQTITTTVTNPTRGTVVVFTVTTPVVALAAADDVKVYEGAACTGTASTNAQITSQAFQSTQLVTVSVRFNTAQAFVLCYTEAGQAAVPKTIAISGPNAINPAAAPLTNTATTITISGTALNAGVNADDVKLVAGPAGNCETSTAIQPCCSGGASLVAMAGADVVYSPVVPYGGVFTVCYRSLETGVSTVHLPVADYTATGPSGYLPAVVPAGTFTLQVDGTGLTPGAGNDQMMITKVGTTCDVANALWGPVDITLDMALQKNIFSGSVAAPGTTYPVCYKLAAAAAYYEFSQKLTVAGATSYSPLTAGGAGSVTLTFTGIALDSTKVGDNAKIVRGVNPDCLSTNAVAIIDDDQFTPVNVKGVTQLSTTVEIKEGGQFTVCYKASLAEEFTALPDIFTVAGAGSFSPTAVPQFFTGDLTFTGALLTAGDKVGVVFSTSTCGSASETVLPWLAVSPVQGTAKIDSATTLALVGEYRVCFTPSGGTQFEMPEKLLVSGAQGVSPTVLRAGVTEVVTVTGNQLTATDRMKLADKSLGEDCTPANPGHGTADLTGTGKFNVLVPYGGVFTLCYSVANAAYAAIATVTVNGARRLSPYLPVVVAVGSAYTFKVEGFGLTQFDSLAILLQPAAMAADCSGGTATSVPALSAPSTTLTQANPVTFLTGGNFVVCYTVSRGVALKLDPTLVVKGPTGVTPAAISFAEATTLTFKGEQLSESDTFRLAPVGKGCTDASLTDYALATPAMAPTDKTSSVSVDKGGLYSVCYKPFEGDFVLLASLTVAGPSSITPTEVSLGTVAVTLTIKGEGLTAGAGGDALKLIDPAVMDCASAGAPKFTATDLVASATAGEFTTTFTPDTVGAYTICYKVVAGAGFNAFGTLSITGVQSYTPSKLAVGYSVTLRITGVGLDPALNRMSIGATCPGAAPDLAVPSGISGTAQMLIYTTEILTGAADQAVCIWLGNAWEQVMPVITVEGPISRANALASTPTYTAGSQIQFTITGVGLSVFDYVRWSRSSGTNTVPCAFPALADQLVVESTSATQSKTPVVQLPGGTFILCYALGSSGEFVPVGSAIGGGNALGEVIITGPTGFYLVNTPDPRIGLPVSLGFVGVTTTETYSVRLCLGGDSNTVIPLASGDEKSFTGGSVTQVTPLLGGTPNVCLKGATSEYFALPLSSSSGATTLLPLSAAGNFTVDGPSTLGLARPSGVAHTSGTAYTFSLKGSNLSNETGVVRWAPSDGGCTDPRWISDQRASVSMVSSEAFTTVFHVAGEYVLCYVYPGDTPGVARFGFPLIDAVGMSVAGSTTLPLGSSTSSFSANYNYTDTANQSPPTHVYFWEQAGSAEPMGSSACPADITIRSDAAKGDFIAGQSTPAYNTSYLASGYYRVCANQGNGYYSMPYLVKVQGPTEFVPPSFVAPGSGTLIFSGVELSDTDKVRLVTLGGPCDGTDPLTQDYTLAQLKLTTQPFAETSKRTVCYLVTAAAGQTTGFVAMPQPLIVTGNPVGIKISGNPDLPTAVTSMAKFEVFGDVIDANGDTVSVNGATMTLSSSGATAVPPIPYNSELSQTTRYGKVNYTIALSTAGEYILNLRYAYGSSQYVVSSTAITVSIGVASTLAATFSPTSLRSGEGFSVAFFVIDDGANTVAEAGTVVTMAVSPLDTAANSGRVIGTLSGTTDASGNGQLGSLNITAPGTYRITMSAVTAAGVALTPRSYDMVVAPGVGRVLEITRQWSEGFTVTAGTTLLIDAQVKDWGGNLLFVDTAAQFFLKVSATPAPPDGAILYDRSPAYCAQNTCDEMKDGVTTTAGVAQFRSIWVNKAGAYKFDITAPTGDASSTLTVSTNTLNVVTGPAYVRITNSTVTVAAGQLFSVYLEVTDVSGTRVTTGLPTGSVVAASTTAGVTLQGTTSQPAVDGVASFTDLRLTVAGDIALQFSYSRLVPAATTISVLSSTLATTPSPPGDSGLSSTELAVIIVAVIIAVILLAILAYLLWKRCTKPAEGKPNDGLGKEPTEGTQPNWQEMPTARESQARGTLHGSRHGGYPSENPLDQAPYTNIYKSPIRTPLDIDAAYGYQGQPSYGRVVQTPAETGGNLVDIDVGDVHPEMSPDGSGLPPGEGQADLYETQAYQQQSMQDAASRQSALSPTPSNGTQLPGSHQQPRYSNSFR